MNKENVTVVSAGLITTNIKFDNIVMQVTHSIKEPYVRANAYKIKTESSNNSILFESKIDIDCHYDTCCPGCLYDAMLMAWDVYKEKCS